MTKRKLRYSGLGLAVLMVGAVAACSSDDNTGGPGGGGTGPKGGSNSGGSAGTVVATGGNLAAGGSNSAGTGTGGSAPTAGSNSGGSAGFACTNTMPACALITDGTNLVANPTRAGDFTLSGAVDGGTYSYAPNALTLDSAGKTALNVKGNVKTYDGVGIYFNTCYNVKTLAYTGVSFTIKGNAGPTGMLNFRVQTNSNTAANDPTNMTNKKGTCIATNAAEPYPDCHAAGKDIAVTSTPTVVTVNFADLAGGLPTAGVDGSDIVGLEWALAWKEGGYGTGGTGAGGAAATGGSSAGGSGGASTGSAGKGGSTAAGGSATGTGGAAPSDGSYNVDITIDDVKFLGGPATATCTTGTGGSGAGGSSSGGGSATAGSSSGGASGGTGGASGGAGGKAGSGG